MRVRAASTRTHNPIPTVRHPARLLLLLRPIPTAHRPVGTGRRAPQRVVTANRQAATALLVSPINNTAVNSPQRAVTAHRLGSPVSALRPVNQALVRSLGSLLTAKLRAATANRKRATVKLRAATANRKRATAVRPLPMVRPVASVHRKTHTARVPWCR